MYLLIRPVPEGRRPPRLGLGPDRVDAVDRRGRQRSWPRSVVSRLRLVSSGVTEADRAGYRVPVASGLAVDGPRGAELVRLPWWGNWHEALEQAAVASGIPLVYAEGSATLLAQPAAYRPQWRESTPVALVLGPSTVAVVARDGQQAGWPRIGYRPAGTPPLGSVPTVARLRLYRDYTTESWLKAVSLVDPWRRELALVRWDSLTGADRIHDAACAAGLLPEFCWESGVPEQLGHGRVPLVV